MQSATDTENSSPESLRPYFLIGLTACAALFIELLLIRWISTEVNIFAYLQNGVLIICFLGLGMGLLFPSKSSLLPSTLGLLLLSILLSNDTMQGQLNIVSGALSQFHDFQTWNDLRFNASFLETIGTYISCFALVFLVTGIVWAVMVPLGRVLGAYFNETSRPMLAYSFDIGGSLMGIWLFSLLGSLAMPPELWLGTAALLLLPLAKLKHWLAVFCAPLVIYVGSTGITGELYWTPYQKIRVYPAADSTNEIQVDTNNNQFQQIQDNSANALAKDVLFSQYDIAARFHQNPEHVLIGGVGTGNDLAGVLRQHPKAQVTAVEIDPLIHRLGGALHPEKPFQNPNVTIVVDDARASFHSQPKGKFDLVITGLLDSHTTPNLSNARLDNFVYTTESIKAVSELLSPEGALVLSFEPQRDYIITRLHRTLKGIFNSEPLVFRVPPSENGWGGTFFVTGNPETITETLERHPELQEFVATHAVKIPELEIEPTTDNWPYLYVKSPAIPSLFAFLALITLMLWLATSHLLSSLVEQSMRMALPNLKQKEMLHFFTLGIGFILIQVFVITKAALLFGSTWIVNSIVISGMLFTILIANFLVSRGIRPPLTPLAFLLVGLCVTLGTIPFSPVLSLPFWSRVGVAILISGAPALLSGLLFGWAFQRAEVGSEALGANLFGALVGAMLQSIVFLFGVSSLAIVGAFAYLCAGLTTSRATDVEAILEPAYG